jgi:DNA invertase Pin-like site-specific DNA recombinase
MEREINIRQPIKPDIPSFKRVAAYVRVSSLKDAMLQSLSNQVSYYNDFIQRHPGWQYAGVYVDEGLTGTKELRPEFQRLLTDCKAGKIDMIITKSTTRFARNTITMLETVRMLKEIGVDVFFEKENIHSMSGDGELMLTILASFAQEESRSVSENCKWRLQEKMKQGEQVGLRGMYGYNVSKNSILIEPGQATMPQHLPLCLEYVRAIRETFKDVKIAVGGRAFETTDRLWEKWDVDVYKENAELLVDWATKNISA